MTLSVCYVYFALQLDLIFRQTYPDKELLDRSDIYLDKFSLFVTRAHCKADVRAQ